MLKKRTEITSSEEIESSFLLLVRSWKRNECVRDKNGKLSEKLGDGPAHISGPRISESGRGFPEALTGVASNGNHRQSNKNDRLRGYEMDEHRSFSDREH